MARYRTRIIKTTRPIGGRKAVDPLILPTHEGGTTRAISKVVVAVWKIVVDCCGAAVEGRILLDQSQNTSLYIVVSRLRHSRREERIIQD